MEETRLSNSLPQVAALAYSQPGFSEALRLQQPFNSQISDAKDTLNLTTFGLRHMESFGGIPAGLVHLNPYLHHGSLERRFSFGSSGAFRPIPSNNSMSNSNKGESSSSKGIKNSNFSMTRKNKVESDNSPIDCRRDSFQQHYERSNINNNSSPQSSAPISLNEESDSLSVHEDMYENTSPINSDSLERSSPEESNNPTRRRKGECLSCPVCKMSIRPLELESHLLSEVEQLMCMSRLRKLGGNEAAASGNSSSSENPSNKINDSGNSGSTDLSLDARCETYHRVRANRHSRLRGKTKRRREDSGAHVTCPVCQTPLQGSNEQFSAHVESCLRKNVDLMDEDEQVDIEGDGDNQDVDDYCWISNHRKGNKTNNYFPTALNMTTNSRRRDEDNLEVVVDGDETSTYGGVQYTDADIHAACHNSSDIHDIKVRPWEDEEGDGDECGGGDILMHSLSGRVREIETKDGDTSTRDGNHCLICMDKYKKPVVSISCWHVHCEECWLKSLGSKKLCPQCNMITSSADLRRIYL